LNLRADKAVTSLQRPLITIFMGICLPIFVGLGFYWQYLIIEKSISLGDIKVALILSSANLMTFGIAWVCYWLARKGVREMKEKGVIYKG